ncbi:MAG: hypothetical protein V1804_02650 [Patescibacteria group bacterium]
MSNLVKVFLVKSLTGYAVIPYDAEPEELAGNTIMLTFDIAEDDRCLLKNFAVLRRIIDRVAVGIEKFFYRKPEQTTEKNHSIAYNDFVGRGRKYFRKVFYNRNDESQRLLLKRVIEEGWKLGRNTIDIAIDFQMNYKTLNGILVEWGIRSNSEFYSGKGPSRKRVYKKR